MAHELTRILNRSIFVAWFILAATLVQCAFWGFDRTPPFELMEYTAFATRPGEPTLLNAVVKRNVDRGCTVVYNRYIVDAKGYRSDIGGQQYMTAEAMEEMQTQTPNKLLVSFTMPESVAPGPAMFTTVLSYTCNPLHKVFPIEVLSKMRIEVLPRG